MARDLHGGELPLDDSRERLEWVAAELDSLRERIDAGTADREQLDEIVAALRGAEISHFGPRPKSNRGDGGKWRMLAYLQKRIGAEVHGAELGAIAGIGEWARRLRELRVEHGYDIEHVGQSVYVLHAADPNAGRAAQWKLANSIRRSGKSVKQKVGDFLRANVGRVVRRDQLDYVAGSAKEATRRLRELRDEEGWPIASRIDDPTLSTSEYVLVSDDPADFRDPNQRAYPDETRRAVFERDEYRCRECRRNRDEALKAGDTRFYLEVDHHVGVADPTALTDEQKADPSNLITLCHRDHAKKTGAFQKKQRKRRRKQ